jgi:hypothetical protein
LAFDRRKEVIFFRENYGTMASAGFIWLMHDTMSTVMNLGVP